jgi:diguanylate cyclase (GGDEF)-like protein
MAMDPQQELTELRRQIVRLTLFHEVGRTLLSTLDLEQVLHTVMAKINELLRPDMWALLLLDEVTKELSFEAALGGVADHLKDIRVKLGEGIAGWVAQRGEAVLTEDVRLDPRFKPEIDDVTQANPGSLLCVPIKARDQVLGVIELADRRGSKSLSPEDVPVVSSLADYAGIAIGNARYVQRIHELTITDDCTALFNARHLNFVLDSEIYRSQRYGYECSVLFMDLDYFKRVNDRYGHLVGSRLLWMIGNVIKSNLRLTDYAFRYGGDEFVVVLPHTHRENALAVTKRIRDLLNSEVFFSEEKLNIKVTASFGLATFPADGRNRKELLRMADEAMYLVKNTTRNNIALAGEGILA